MFSKKKNNKPLKRIVLIILSIFLLVLLGGGIYLYNLLGQINEVPLVLYEDDDSEGDFDLSPEDMGIAEDAPDYGETGVLNVLLFGLDRRSANERARSDSIMIASIDKRNKEIKLTSLMRDMYVPIPGRQDNRINAAYAFGGPALAIKTVNQNFNMNIQHYIAIDFFGFEELVDLVGGVEINVSEAERSSVGVPTAGRQILDGTQALNYARIRKVGNSDFKRTERQRTVLNELFKKSAKTSILKMPELLSASLPKVETNLTRTELMMFGKDILAFGAEDIDELRLPADGAYRNETIRGMMVLVPDMDKNKSLLHEFIYGSN